MKKILLITCLILGALITKAQTKVTYYNKQYEQVTEQKARYVKTETTIPNGLNVTREIDLKTGKVTQNDTFKGSEPYGIWKSGREVLDYSFALVYTENECDNNNLLPKLNNYFVDVDSLRYKAPMVSEKVTFHLFLAKNLIYPAPAKENNIQGRVKAKFTIGKDGSVSNISIIDGVNVVLDKEFVRILRKLKFATPPKINGQPVELCVTVPCVFRLE